MGSPLGPLLANIWMSHLEDIAFNNCPCNTPTYYRRYVDDIFLIFDDKSHVTPFLDYMNTLCDSIKFTMEPETNGVIHFLDVLVTRCVDSLSTTVYRKPTFSGLYLRWDSFVPKKHKSALVNTLIYRSWRICSSFELFDRDLKFIKSTLLCNGYPYSFIDSCVNRFLHRQYNAPPVVQGPEQEKLYIFLPYTSDSVTLKRHLTRLLNVLIPSIQLITVFRPSHQLSRLSRLKCNLKTIQNSNVVYKINCKDCLEFYIGMSTRILKHRIIEHSTQSTSALLNHSIDTNHCIAFNDVVILDHDVKKTNLLIREAIHIKQQHAEASLNRNVGAFNLQLW